MFKIQQLTVKDPASLTPSVRLTIADSTAIDEASAHLVATVTIDREGESVENVELAALDKILELVAFAKAAVNETSDELQKR